MDTSETYIKMRLAAIPDLGRGQPHEELGRWLTRFLFIDGKGDFYYTEGGLGYPATACQLERQDQLQEMVRRMGEGLEASFTRFKYHYTYFDDDGTEAIGVKQCKSWEQLWFLFLMKEKYQKRWNGEEWVKVE